MKVPPMLFLRSDLKENVNHSKTMTCPSLMTLAGFLQIGSVTGGTDRYVIQDDRVECLSQSFK